MNHSRSPIIFIAQILSFAVAAVATTGCAGIETPSPSDENAKQQSSALNSLPLDRPVPVTPPFKHPTEENCNSTIEMAELSAQCVMIYECTDNACYPIEEICSEEAQVSFSLQPFGDGCMTLLAEASSSSGTELFGPFCPEQCPATWPVVPACQEGETKVADDGCNTCACTDGQWICTLKGCGSEPRRECKEGMTKIADDGCNSCQCRRGQWACTAMLCTEDDDDDNGGLPTDCDGEFVPDPWKILGDGTCQDGGSDYNLNCAEWDFDGGDC